VWEPRGWSGKGKELSSTTPFLFYKDSRPKEIRVASMTTATRDNIMEKTIVYYVRRGWLLDSRGEEWAKLIFWTIGKGLLKEAACRTLITIIINERGELEEQRTRSWTLH